MRVDTTTHAVKCVLLSLSRPSGRRTIKTNMGIRGVKIKTAHRYKYHHHGYWFKDTYSDWKATPTVPFKNDTMTMPLRPLSRPPNY